MSHFKNTKIALDSKLNALTGSTPIAWENIPYKPVLGTSYIRQTLIPAQSQDIDLGTLQLNQGIYQVDVFYPVNQGVATLLEKMDDIYDLFKGAVLTVGDTKVNINSIARLRFSQEESWLMGSVQINFSSYN